MKLCNAHGLPHSQFLSWSPEDRSKALAFEIESQLHCQSCGTAKWEWEEDPFAYEVVDEFCPGCYQLEYMQDSQSKEAGHRLNLSSTATVAAARRAVAGAERDRVRASAARRERR